jgi:hypothetical protein
VPSAGHQTNFDPTHLGPAQISVKIFAALAQEAVLSYAIIEEVVGKPRNINSLRQQGEGQLIPRSGLF